MLIKFAILFTSDSHPHEIKKKTPHIFFVPLDPGFSEVSEVLIRIFSPILSQVWSPANSHLPANSLYRTISINQEGVTTNISFLWDMFRQPTTSFWTSILLGSIIHSEVSITNNLHKKIHTDFFTAVLWQWTLYLLNKPVKLYKLNIIKLNWIEINIQN